LYLCSYEKYVWDSNLEKSFRSELIAKLLVFNQLLIDIDFGDRGCVNNILNNFTCLLRGVADPFFMLPEG
jgi:hypothetical protein